MSTNKRINERVKKLREKYSKYSISTLKRLITIYETKELVCKVRATKLILESKRIRLKLQLLEEELEKRIEEKAEGGKDEH